MGTLTAPHTITRIMTRPIMTEATAVGIVVVLMAAAGVTDQGSGVGSASLECAGERSCGRGNSGNRGRWVQFVNDGNSEERLTRVCLLSA
jgi:hypothetical protein